MASELLDSSSSSPPPKRLRIETLTLAPSSKGKQKLDDGELEHDLPEQQQRSTNLDSDMDRDKCGICLSEEGKAIRGSLDCCNHYFCFFCIMEWSKVESRCPICKRRFSSIRRSLRPGLYAWDRLVNVPVRDQGYDYLGNATTGAYVPYEDANCSVCHGTSDESLLLLCDLCDSAAHTYCVGLGMTVPENDWFCPDCAISMDERAFIDNDMDNLNDGSLQNISARPSAPVSVSVSRVIQEPSITEVKKPHTVVSSNVEQLSSDVVQVSSHVNQVSSRADRPLSPVVQASSYRNPLLPPVILNQENRVSQTRPPCSIGNNTRTLQHCRSVHKHIQILRENWNALRRGSLSFSSQSKNSSRKSNGKPNNDSVPCDRGQFLSRSPGCHLLPDNGSKNNSGPYDVDKAWRMMKMAKSTQQACGRTHSAPDGLKNVAGKGNSSKTIQTTIKGHSVPRKTDDLGSIGSKRHDKSYSDYTLMKSEYKKRGHFSMKEASSFNEVPPATSVNGCAKMDLRKFEVPHQAHNLHKNIRSSSHKNLDETCKMDCECNQFPCGCSLARRIPETSELFHHKQDLGIHISFSSELRGLSEQRCCAEGKPRKDDDAKREIQSIVKLNLKLLSRSKSLGVHTFKEVARNATHTILAACGLEHKRSDVNPCESSVCKHNEQIQQLRKSTLMPNSCRECFYAFVKDVVDTTMREGLGCG